MRTQSKAMPKIIEALKAAEATRTLKFDTKCNEAVRANNEAICTANEESPAEGGNMDKLKEMQGEAASVSGHEYSVFKYEGANAEEFVAMLLFKDCDRQTATDEPADKDGDKKDVVEGDENLPAEEAPAEAVPSNAPKPLVLGLLDPTVETIGISNKRHEKCLNSI